MNRFSAEVMILLSSLFCNALQAQDEQLFNLEEAYAIARQNSPDIEQARLSLERSQDLLNAQEASLKSRFGFVLEPFYYNRASEFNNDFSAWSTSETKSYSGSFIISQPIIYTDGVLALRNQFGWRDSNNDLFNTQNELFSNNLYLSYDQPLFTYNRTQLALEEVRLDLENALLNYQLRELQLERQVAQSFYTAYQNKMSLQVAKEDYLNRQQSYQIIKNKVDAGLAAQEELFQAELDLTSSQSQVRNDEVALSNTLDEFKQLLGLEIAEQISVVAEISQEPVDVDLDKALSYGLKSRLELQQRNIDLALSEANVVRAAATNEFKGNVSLTYGVIGASEQLNNVYEVPTKNQSLILSFDIPVWDWGEQRSRTRAAETSVRQQNLNTREERKSIEIGIRRAYRNLQNQVLQIELARQNVRSAQLTYDINLERYENGDLTSMDLNLFQNQLSQKKIGLVNAMISYKIYLLDLKIQSMWDFEKDQPVVTIQKESANEDD